MLFRRRERFREFADNNYDNELIRVFNEGSLRAYRRRVGRRD